MSLAARPFANHHLVEAFPSESVAAAPFRRHPVDRPSADMELSDQPPVSIHRDLEICVPDPDLAGNTHVNVVMSHKECFRKLESGCQPHSRACSSPWSGERLGHLPSASACSKSCSGIEGRRTAFRPPFRRALVTPRGAASGLLFRRSRMLPSRRRPEQVEDLKRPNERQQPFTRPS